MHVSSFRDVRWLPFSTPLEGHTCIETLTGIEGNCTNALSQDKLLFVEKLANTGPQTTYHVATQTIQRKHISHFYYAVFVPMIFFFTIPSVVLRHSYLWWQACKLNILADSAQNLQCKAPWTQSCRVFPVTTCSFSFRDMNILLFTHTHYYLKLQAHFFTAPVYKLTTSTNWESS